jgi:hypothetical protein
MNQKLKLVKLWRKLPFSVEMKQKTHIIMNQPHYIIQHTFDLQFTRCDQKYCTLNFRYHSYYNLFILLSIDRLSVFLYFYK